MELSNEKLRELTKEESFYELILSSRRLTHKNEKWVLFYSSSFGLVHAVYCYISNIPSADFADQLRRYVELGFTYAVTMLGFVLAGFTIFSSVSNPDFLRALTLIEDKNNNAMPYLKVVFLRFVEIFATFFVLTSITMLMLLVGSKQGIIATIIYEWSPQPQAQFVRRIIICAGDALLVSMFVYSLFALSAFIFNTFHVVMATQRFVLLNNESTREPTTSAVSNNASSIIEKASTLPGNSKPGLPRKSRKKWRKI